MSAAEEARRQLIDYLTRVMIADGAPADDAEAAATAQAETLTDAEAITAAAWGRVIQDHEQ